MNEAEQLLLDMVNQAGGTLDYPTIHANTPHPHKDRLYYTVNSLRAAGKIKRWNEVDADSHKSTTMIQTTGS